MSNLKLLFLLCVCVTILCSCVTCQENVFDEAQDPIFDDEEDVEVIPDYEPVQQTFEEPIVVQEEDTITREEFIEKPRIEQYRLIWKRWWIEIIAVVVAQVVFLHTVWGKNKNSFHVTKWMKNIAPILESNFVQTTVDGALILQRGWSSFETFCSGRENCRFCLIIYEAAPRQCMWVYTGLSLISNQTDTVTFEIALDSLDTVSLLVGPKKKFKKLRNAYADIGECASVRQKPELKNMSIVSDSQEAVERILTSEVRNTLKEIDKNLLELVVSDVLPHTRDTNITTVLKVKFSVDMKDLSLGKKIASVVMTLIDNASHLELSSKGRTEAQQGREVLAKKKFRETADARQEKIEQKKIDKKKESDERFEKMTPDQQRKFEEKQFKKQIKKRQQMRVVRA